MMLPLLERHQITVENKHIIMKRIIGLFALSFICISVFAQENILLTIANEKVSVEDFMSIYNKNRQENNTIDAKQLEEYLDLFINFKLKVKEAEALGMDTVASFVKELDGYRKQLAKPYLIDKEVGEALIKEAYDRLNYEVNVSHILITVGIDASPKDTLTAYNKILDIRSKIQGGQDFIAMAKKNSEDPSVNQNGGNLGYFSALYMVYPFENAAYTTPIGELSKIIRTRFGYHLLKVNDKRKSRGELKTAHIMIKFDSSTGKNNPEEVLRTKLKIDEIYSKLINDNADFKDMCAQYSDDKNSAKKGGELPWFGSNRMVESFEEAAFNIKNRGDISQPIQTPYGWHIIKLIEKRGIESFEKEKEEIVKKVEKDSRSEAKTTAIINRLKKEYSFNQYSNNLNLFKKNLIRNGPNSEVVEPKYDTVLFDLDARNFTQNQFLDFIKLNSKTKMTETAIDQLYKEWVDTEILAYEDSRLEYKFADFRLLMQEYRDGILLYELTDEKVWSRAVKDTLGLKGFYNSNKSNYMWPSRIEAKVLNFTDARVANKVRKKLSKKSPNFDLIEAKVNKTSSLTMDVNSDVFAKGDNQFVDSVVWKKGVSEILIDKPNYKLVYITNVIEPEAKKLNEAKGLITSDYQDYLENLWLSSLKNKFDVSVNYQVFDLLKNNKLSQINNSEVEVVKSEKNIIPVYTGNFSLAFSNAVKDLGASKSTLFEWGGGLYTTEIK